MQWIKAGEEPMEKLILSLTAPKLEGQRLLIQYKVLMYLMQPPTPISITMEPIHFTFISLVTLGGVPLQLMVFLNY